VAYVALISCLLVSLMSARRASAVACVVRGDAVRLDRIFIHPIGERKVSLDAYSLPATARIGAAPGAPVALTFAGTLAFDATASNVWYRIARPVVARHGMVQLLPGARIARAHADGGDVIGQVVWTADDVLEGEDTDPDETLGSVRVPCAALALGSGEPEEVENDGAGNADDGDGGGDADAETASDDAGNSDDEIASGDWWETRRGSARLVLRAAPRPTAATVTLRSLVDRDTHWPFVRLAGRGTWMKVTGRGERARVTGWIPRADLVQLPAAPASSGGCSGHHGRLYGRRFAGKPETIVYKGPAEIQVGTTIYVSPGAGPWAKVTKRDPTFEVMVIEGADWTELTGLPGLSGAVGFAYVRAGAVVPIPKAAAK
jgi:hypothetical protein